MPPAAPLPVRFWNKVDRRRQDQCWPFLGYIRGNGYGWVKLRPTEHPRGLRGPTFAHRVAYYLAFGSWPPVVMHRCDNTVCCNPAHLQAGTQQDNIADMDGKGRRGAWGSRNGRRAG
jgi:hypothetical protein